MSATMISNTKDSFLPLTDSTRRLIERAPRIYDNEYVFVDISTVKVHDTEYDRFEIRVAQCQVFEGENEGSPPWFDYRLDENLYAIVVYESCSHELNQIFTYALPGSKWMGDMKLLRSRRSNVWRAPKTDITAICLSRWIPKDRLHFANEGVETEFKFLIARLLSQSINAEVASEFKLNKVLPELPQDWLESSQYPLEDYQRVACLLSLNSECYTLFMDRGTGKTPVAVNSICMDAKRFFEKTGKMYRCLIVTTGETRSNWVQEIERFATIPGKVSVLRGGVNDRINTLIDAMRTEDDCLFSVVVTGYDTVPVTESALIKCKWNLIITDESQNYKSSSTKRFKSLVRLRDRADRRLGLTGSPIGNVFHDLWSQLEFLGEGMSGFNTLKEFRKYYMIDNERLDQLHGINKMTALGLRNMPMLQERLARISFSITKEEAGLNLPPKLPEIYEVEMTKKQREFYIMMADQLLVEFAELDKNDSMTANHILTRLLRLAQITSGHVKWDAKYDAEGNEIEAARVEQIEDIHSNPKINATIKIYKEMIEEDPNSKMIVWTTFIEDMLSLKRRFQAEGIEACTYYGGTKQDERVRIKKEFNDRPELRVLIGHPKTAGEGLNLLGYDWWNDPPTLDTHTSSVVFFSQNWSSIMRSQAEDRAHRRGTKVSPRIIDLMMYGTIDEEIRRRVTAKLEMAAIITDVSTILQSIVNMKGKI